MADDEICTELAALVVEHRPNVVNEQVGVLDGIRGERTWRTRAKCDGDDCGFYAEGPRYWEVVGQHSDHLTTVLAEYVATKQAEAVAEAGRRIEHLRQWNPINGDCSNHTLTRAQNLLVRLAGDSVEEAILAERATIQAERDAAYLRLEAENNARNANPEAGAR